MARKRKKVDKHFKAEAVRLSYMSDSVREVASDLGIHVNTLYRWRSELSAEKPDSSSVENDSKSPEEVELSLLRKRLADKEEELEILKKAIGIFSKSDGRSMGS